MLTFKTLSISKIVQFSMLTDVPSTVTNKIQSIQKNFLWKSSQPNINHKTLCNTFDDRRLKNANVKIKIISLQCSWIGKLYDYNFHEWKIILLYLISKHFGKNFNFHSSLSFNATIVKNFPKFYKEILINWQNYFTSTSDRPSCILHSFLWYNKNILINNKTVYIANFLQ